MVGRKGARIYHAIQLAKPISVFHHPNHINFPLGQKKKSWFHFLIPKFVSVCFGTAVIHFWIIRYSLKEKESDRQLGCWWYLERHHTVCHLKGKDAPAFCIS